MRYHATAPLVGCGGCIELCTRPDVVGASSLCEARVLPLLPMSGLKLLSIGGPMPIRLLGLVRGF